MNALLLLLLLWPLWLIRRPEQDTPIWGRRSLIMLISLFTFRYLIWRVTSSLNFESRLSITLSVLLLLAEAWLLLVGLVPLWLAWRRFPDRRLEINDRQKRWAESCWEPHVDILVPTYGEPIKVLERALIGCTNLSYPHTKVWVLDDSGRHEVKALATELGCRYLHRAERVNAKAGNLNHGLRHCRGELVAVFDADFIPQRTFLDRSIGFLLEPDVALIQTPQTFINADPVMRNLGMENWLLSDEESFYRWIQPVRDGWGAVVCAGTSFVVKRKALDQIGGFVEQAISEDFVTGISLTRQHGRLLYLQEKLSAGLAAETMADFVHQRQRWASGTLQSLRLSSGPLRRQGLSLGQRIAYLEGVMHWFNNVPRLVLMLMPLSYGLLGIIPILLNSQAALTLLLPLWSLQMLSLGWLNRGSRTAFLSELTGWVLTVPLTVTVLANLIGRIGGFRVTPKHQRRDRGSYSAELLLPLLALVLFNLVNLYGLLSNASDLPAQVLAGRPVGLVWGVINLLSLIVAIRACWDPAAQDLSPWQKLKTEAWIEDDGGHRYPCCITALSESGARITYSRSPLPWVASSRLRWCQELPALPVNLMHTTETEALLHWGHLPRQERYALIRWLFCRPGCWVDRQAPQEGRALLALVRRLIAPPKSSPFNPSLIPQHSSTLQTSAHEKIPRPRDCLRG